MTTAAALRLRDRAEVAMWGALACAQPWLAAERYGTGLVWLAFAALCWVGARLIERQGADA